MIIGICDDEVIIRNHVRDICKKIVAKYEDDIVIETFSDGMEVADRDLDILILDIEMDGVDGISVKNI